MVLSEMENAPWWKFAGYIACILFMMAPCLQPAVLREHMTQYPHTFLLGRHGVAHLRGEGKEKPRKLRSPVPVSEDSEARELECSPCVELAEAMFAERKGLC